MSCRLRLTFLTSSREEVTGLAAEDIAAVFTGVLTLLCRAAGSLGSTAFLARSLRAAANVDFALAGEGGGW